MDIVTNFENVRKTAGFITPSVPFAERRIIQMKILYELSWLWKTLGIALAATVGCLTCVALICRAKKREISQKMAAAIGVAAFVVAVIAVIVLARTPALI